MEDITRKPDCDPVRNLYNNQDEHYWNELEILINNNDFRIKDILQHYLSFIQRRDLPRLLAHYEMFKLIQNLPGSIIEIGVYTGKGLFTWSNLFETFCTGDRLRKVFGFDSFDGYSKFHEFDKSALDFVNKFEHHLKINKEFILKLSDLHNNDNILKGVERQRIIIGEIEKTVPEFVMNSKGLRLCMLYLDANLYLPTKIAIEYFFDLVVPGGIIAFNGYGQQPWNGESKALDELFSKLTYTPKINRFTFSNIPSGYFIKKI